MIHRSRDLSPDQKTVIEGLLGRAVSEDEAISIRTLGSDSAPEWLRASWNSAKLSGVDQLTLDEIDAEIDAARNQRIAPQSACVARVRGTRIRGAMIRVVLDTNVLISALLTPQGLPAQLLLLCTVDPELEFAVSAAIYAEYEEVIRRPKFKKSGREINAILDAINGNCLWITPTATLRVCADPNDDIFLECAQAAGARYLVTGNTRHFPAVWEETRIVTARQFLELST